LYRHTDPNQEALALQAGADDCISMNSDLRHAAVRTVQAAAGLDRPLIVRSPNAFNIAADDATVEGFEAQQPSTASGVGNDVIMVYDTDSIRVRNNKVKGAGPPFTWQDKNPGPGIAVLTSRDVNLEGNDIADTTEAGIWFGSSTGSSINYNRIVDTQYTGTLRPNWISIGPSHHNTIEGNRVRSAGNDTMVYDDGIRLGAAAHDNTVRDKRVSAAIRDGIHAVASTHHNTIQDNVIRGSGTGPTGRVDARDQSSGSGTAGTANTWTGRSCGVHSPEGLC
jgi:parallel beta-helix repeat protein